MSTAVTIIVAVLGSTALATLIQFFVNRHDLREGIQNKLIILEKDGLRTQLLLLILLRPDDEHEILTIGEKYFSDKAHGGLEGNWYATPIFNRWCDERKIEPEWFNRNR